MPGAGSRDTNEHYTVIDLLVLFMLAYGLLSLTTLLWGHFHPLFSLAGALAATLATGILLYRNNTLETGTTRIATLLLLVTAALFVRTLTVPSENAIRDAIPYLTAAHAFERSGKILQTDRVREAIDDPELGLVYDRSNHTRQTNGTTSYLPQTTIDPNDSSRYYFEHYPLYPLWLSLFERFSDRHGVTLSATLFTLLSIIFLYHLLLLLGLDERFALAGGLLYAIDPLAIDLSFSGLPYGMAQALLLGGLYYLLRYTILARRKVYRESNLFLSFLLITSLFFALPPEPAVLVMLVVLALFTHRYIDHDLIRMPLLAYCFALLLAFLLSVWYAQTFLPTTSEETLLWLPLLAIPPILYYATSKGWFAPPAGWKDTIKSMLARLRNKGIDTPLQLLLLFALLLAASLPFAFISTEPWLFLYRLDTLFVFSLILLLVLVAKSDTSNRHKLVYFLLFLFFLFAYRYATATNSEEAADWHETLERLTGHIGYNDLLLEEETGGTLKSLLYCKEDIATVSIQNKHFTFLEKETLEHYDDIFLLLTHPWQHPHITPVDALASPTALIPKSGKALYLYKIDKKGWLGDLPERKNRIDLRYSKVKKVGFYPDSAWSTGEALITGFDFNISDARYMRISVYGDNPLGYDPAVTKFNLFVDKKNLTFHSKQGKFLYYTIDQDHAHEIYFRVRTFRPVDYGMGEDKRELGMDIITISFIENIEE
jgi:Ca2+/Na+ antiporter